MYSPTQERDTDGKFAATGSDDARSPREQRRAARDANRQAVSAQLDKAATAATEHFRAGMDAQRAEKLADAKAEHESREDDAEAEHNESEDRAATDHAEEVAQLRREHEAGEDKDEKAHNRAQAKEKKAHDRYYDSGEAAADHEAYLKKYADRPVEQQRAEHEAREAKLKTEDGDQYRPQPFVPITREREPYVREQFEAEPYERQTFEDAYDAAPYERTPYERREFEPNDHDTEPTPEDRKALGEAAHAQAMTLVDGEARERLGDQKGEFVRRLAKAGKIAAKQRGTQMNPSIATARISASDGAKAYVLDTDHVPEMRDPTPEEIVGLPTKNGAGEPIHHRWVMAAPGGKWSHVRTGQPIDIPPEREDEWVSNIDRLAKAGRKPFLTFQHVYDAMGTGYYDPDARNTAGYVERAKREGKDAWALCSIHGDDNLKVVARNRLSVGILSGARDSNGNVYEGEWMHHLASCPNPVLTGRDGTVKLAASAGVVGSAADVYTRFAPMTAAERQRMPSLARSMSIPDGGHIRAASLAATLGKLSAQLSN